MTALVRADVERAAAGDLPAFERLVNQSRNAVCSIALAIVGDFAASEDIAQEVFITAWRRMGQLRNPDSFLPWVRQTTRHRAYNWLRDHRREDRSAHAQDKLVATASQLQAPPEAVQEDERQQLLNQALMALTADLREVVILYYREGQSVAQVARLLDLSTDAVKQRLSRARKHMRTDVSRRLAALLIHTAPGLGLTSLVLSSLTPSAKAAVGAVGGLKAGSQWLWPKAITSFGGILVGFAIAVASVVLPWRGESRRTSDPNARKRLNRFLVAGITVLVIIEVGFFWSGSWGHWLGPTLIYTAFIGALALLYEVWLPKILRDRDDAQGVSKSEQEARERVRRRNSRLGWTLGLSTGTAGLIGGLITSGLI